MKKPAYAYDGGNKVLEFYYDSNTGTGFPRSILSATNFRASLVQSRSIYFSAHSFSPTHTAYLLFVASNMAVKNYPKEFVVFSGFNVNEFTNKGYLERINLLRDCFVGKKRVFRVRLRRGNNTERMLISLIEAEELPEISAVRLRSGRAQQALESVLVKFDISCEE